MDGLKPVIVAAGAALLPSATNWCEALLLSALHNAHAHFYRAILQGVSLATVFDSVSSPAR